MAELLIYGSYGYNGRLISEEAADRGLEPILAGRDGEALGEQARELDRPYRAFDLSDPAVAEELSEVDCVLNCAGPFSNTADELVEACIESGTDYVDITGEIPVIERVKRKSEEAEEAGITLFPAAGLSSVPMDCLSAHLVERLPDATRLALGSETFRPPSVGSITTLLEGLEDGGAIRNEGRLEYVPAAWKSRWIDFGRGVRPAVTMPLGDVSTSYYTTGVPNVEVYTFAPPPARLTLRAHRYVAPLLAVGPVRETLKRIAQLAREGPSKRARERGSTYFWGRPAPRTGHERSPGFE
ncbi:saccharopine dehydrogenase family protein [Halalkalicoccus salilacus]|uniref:saccharopine dehydrogenase family protein n=1 Tax=Halalkalicoccus sp. GCM10025704 TaxID=3252662 RepID=UPI0036137F5E